MPVPKNPFRVLAGLILALPLAGCAAVEDANRAIGRADLVNDLAARMDRAMGFTYSAVYQLAGGQTASIAQAQEPPRSAYTYPGGKLTVTDKATTECDTAGPKPSCTLSPPPVPSNRPSVTVFTEASQRGLITPPVVIGLLTAAALDPAAVIEQTDTTVAGHHATCVQVRQVSTADASPFDACVTTEGVLGSFHGVIDGKPVDLALTRYRDSVDPDAFDLPTGARVVDRRTTAP